MRPVQRQRRLRVAGVLVFTTIGGLAPGAMPAAATPANVSPPRISGRAQVGRVLFGHKGTWNPRGRYTYQWLRCDASGGACQPIPGAMRVIWRTTADDAGHTLVLQVTATDRHDGTTATALSPATQLIQSSTPVNVVAPFVHGRPQLGRYLFAKKGVWNPRGRVRYQWLRCDATGGACQPIPFATKVIWKVLPEDVGSTLAVQVTVTSNVDRTFATATSAATAVVTG